MGALRLLAGVASGGATAVGASLGVGASIDSAVSFCFVSGGAVSTIVALKFGCDCVKSLPHCGQKKACSRKATPHQGQRRAIMGSVIGISDCGVRISGFVASLFYYFETQKYFFLLSPETRNPKSATRNSNPVHGVKEIFSLRVDTHAELLALAAQTLF